MLIIYDRRTGQVLDNTGTHSGWPLGPPDSLLGDLIATNTGDTPREHVAYLRVHGDSDLAGELLVRQHSVDPDTREVVLGEPWAT